MYKIVILLSRKKLLLYKNDILYKVYNVAIGKGLTPTPKGNYRIIQKALYPGGAFGSRWMRFYNGYGIHGTNADTLIGQPVSHGCVRMHNKDVEQLYDLVPLGTEVKIKL